MCVWGSQQACGELYSTLRYIGKPEKFPFQRGGNIEKRGQVSSEQNTDRMLQQSTPSPHLPVTAVTPPGSARSPDHCEYNLLDIWNNGNKVGQMKCVALQAKMCDCYNINVLIDFDY